MKLLARKIIPSITAFSITRLLVGLSAISIAVLSACQPSKKNNVSFPENSIILGNASPIILNNDTSTVHLEDYIIDLTKIDSTSISEGISIQRHEKTLQLIGNLKKPLGVLTIWHNGFGHSVLLKKSNKKEVSLHYPNTAEVVKVKGEFNAWNANNSILQNTSEGFVTTLKLNPGKYQYLFVVDGKEIRDPHNNDSISNGNGGWNSVLNIPRPEKSTLPIITTKSYSDNSISLSFNNKPEKVFAFWQNSLLTDEHVALVDNSIEIKIPKISKAHQRSFIRLWAYNENGLSNDILIPLSNGTVLDKSSQLLRSDKEAMILYFLMVDRFNNGNKDNDEPLDDPNVLPKANYYGGDLVGVREKIEDGYFDSLGINTVWLSPITQNPITAYGKFPDPATTFSGYHGYWPISSTTVDYRFGTSEEFQELVDVAHKHNMNVLLDYVANHVHELHPVYQKNKDWVTPLYLPDGTMNTEKWDEHRLTTWFDTFLPTLDLSRPEIVDPMTDSAIFWLEKYKIDGFRHDATKHIPLLFWRELTKKVKKRVVTNLENPVFQIGETYGSRELINSYVGSGMLDAQFDFNMYDDAVAVFAKKDKSFSRLTSSLKESLAYYGDHNLMGYITGNQDRARFITYADGSLRFDANAKYEGWTRKIEVSDSVAYQKLSMLTAYMMFIPGVPTIYYGDEIGMPGAGDPDNRRMMRFDNITKLEKATRERSKKMIALRKNNLALIYGDIKILEETDNTLVLQRNYFDNHVIAVFNNSAITKNIPLPSVKNENHFGGTLKLDDNASSIILPPYSFEIITYKK